MLADAERCDDCGTLLTEVPDAPYRVLHCAPCAADGPRDDRWLEDAAWPPARPFGMADKDAPEDYRR
jgi:hypothetical protein